MYKRYEYWSKSGKVWTNWFYIDDEVEHTPIQFGSAKNGLKNEYMTDEEMSLYKKKGEY